LSFIEGLELFGKGWKKIASLVKTRSVVQIRTHAQKYFLKLSKNKNKREQDLDHNKKINNTTNKKVTFFYICIYCIIIL
jgi:SHAQKYF class myb-like DNA-binding protein